MEFIFNMNNQFSLMHNLVFFVQILIACACGACIGFERSWRLKEAGIRTHIIVCCASALLMIVSKYGFADLVDQSGNLFSGVRDADPSRIAAQAVSGISFLGAGAIFRHKNIIKGLTTAAGIWATAGIGLAIGAGMYWIGLFSTLLIVLIQVIMHKFTYGTDAFVLNALEFVVNDKAKFAACCQEIEKELNGKIMDFNISKEGKDLTKFNIHLRTKDAVTMMELQNIMDSHKEILTASTSYL